MKISVDFDDCLCFDGSPNRDLFDIIQKHHEAGDEIHIVTARVEKHEAKWWIEEHDPDRTIVADFIEKHKLPITKVHYTSHCLKGPTLKKHGIEVHYDDKAEHLLSAFHHGIRTYYVDYHCIIEVVFRDEKA